MLKDLLNLLGRRDGGPAGFLIAAKGEPLARDAALEFMLKGLAFDAKRDPFDVGRRSWGGETVKASSSVRSDVLDEKLPHPNLNVVNVLFS